MYNLNKKYLLITYPYQGHRGAEFLSQLPQGKMQGTPWRCRQADALETDLGRVHKLSTYLLGLSPWGPAGCSPKKGHDHPPVDLPSTGGRQKGDCSVCLVAVNGINRGRQIPGKPMVCSLQLQVGERVLTVICSYALNNSTCPC